VLERYVQAVLREIKPTQRRLHVVVDCANGAGSIATPSLLSHLGCKVTAINANMDGSFPGRSPEPTAENLTELQKLVSQLGADLAIAHDSDADRLSVLDERGYYVTNDRLLAFFAKILLKHHGRGRIVTSVDTSPRIDEVAQRYGGQVERTRLGKTHEALVREEKPVLCCEPWKIIDTHWGQWGDGIYAACRLVSELSEAMGPLSKLLKDIPDYPQRRIAFPCPDQIKDIAMETIKTKLASERNVKDIWTYDGLRINYLDGSFLLLRPSGTEPRIRAYCEARSERRLQELVEKCTSLVRTATRT
jgi:phosphomannomutase